MTDINGSREIICDVNRAEDHADCVDKSYNHEEANSSILKLKSNGVIIPSKDVNALYEAMKRMVTDKDMREQMATDARPMIESRFEQGFVRKCLYEFYEQVLER